MTGKQRILTALRRGTPDAVPTFEWFIDSAVARALTGSEDALEIGRSFGTVSALSFGRYYSPSVWRE